MILLLITIIISECRKEDIRWAIIIVVFALRISIKRSKICLSVLVSTAERASSKIKIRGLVSKALAIATLCFCPPERVKPRSPTIVPN